MNKAIDISALYKRYSSSDKYAVENVSFSAQYGQALALIGANGSGKTTLIRLISGIIRADAGNIEVAGQDVLHETSFKRKIGVLLSSENSLYERLSAYENALYFSRIFGVDRQEFEFRTKIFSEMFQMNDFIKKRSAGYSKGMKQKSLLLRSIIHNPEIVLLDEPSGGLDIHSSIALRKFIKQCVSEKKAVIFSSHDMDEIKSCADRILFLKNGRTEYFGSSSQFFSKYKKITDLR